MKKRTLKYLFLIAAIMFCVSSNTKVQAASDLKKYIIEFKYFVFK